MTPAMQNCNTNSTSVIANMMPITAANDFNTTVTSPAMVMFRKMPNMYSGSRGMINRFMVSSTQSRNSAVNLRIVSVLR